MEHAEYQKIADVGERMWWFRALHRNMLMLFRYYRDERDRPLLDAGCGAGGFLRKFLNRYPDVMAYGIDIEPVAVNFARKNTKALISCGNVNSLPFSDKSFGACISADIIYHKEAFPKDVLSEAYRCLEPGGILIVGSPAYDWMFSVHDVRVSGVRRFTRKSLSVLLKETGFHIEYATYWNTLLFPLMVIRRKVFSSLEGDSDLTFLPRPLEVSFNFMTVIESLFLKALRPLGLFLPFGGSVMVVARRPKETS